MILHTDSARSYKAKVRGVLHDSVVHQKKRVKVRGKFVWKSPNFVKLVTHKLPCGKKLRVKAGTQIIDRTWRFIKDRLRLNQFTKVGGSLLRAQIRSAQYEQWHRNRDLWACTGEPLSAYMQDILVQLPVSAAMHSGENCSAYRSSTKQKQNISNAHIKTKHVQCSHKQNMSNVHINKTCPNAADTGPQCILQASKAHIGRSLGGIAYTYIYNHLYIYICIQSKYVCIQIHISIFTFQFVRKHIDMIICAYRHLYIYILCSISMPIPMTIYKKMCFA